MYSVEDYWGIRFDKEPTLPYEWDMPSGNNIDFFTSIEVYSKDFDPPQPPAPTPEYPEVGGWHISSGSLVGTEVTVSFMDSSNEMTVINNSFVTVGLVEMYPDGSTKFLDSTPTGTTFAGIILKRGVKYGMGEVVGEVTTITPPPEYPETGGWYISSGTLDGTGVRIEFSGNSNEMTVINNSGVEVGLIKIISDGNTEFLGSTPTGTTFAGIILESGVKYGMGEVGKVMHITIEQQMFTPPPIEVVGEDGVDIRITIEQQMFTPPSEELPVFPKPRITSVVVTGVEPDFYRISTDYPPNPPAPTPEYPEVGGWYISSGSQLDMGVTIIFKGSDSDEITAHNDSGVTVGLVEMYPDGSTKFLGSTPAGTTFADIILVRGVKYGMGYVIKPPEPVPVYPEVGGWYISSGTLDGTGVRIEFSGNSNEMTVINNSGVEVGLIKIISDGNTEFLGSTPTGTTFAGIILESGVKYGMGEVGKVMHITIEQQMFTPPPIEVVGEDGVDIRITIEQQMIVPPIEPTTSVSVPSFNTSDVFPYNDITYYKDNVKYKATEPSELFHPITDFQKYDFVSSFVPSSETEKIYTMNITAYTDTLPAITEVFVFRVYNDWTAPRKYLDRIMDDTEHFFRSIAVPTIPLIPISVPVISINTVPSNIIDAPVPEPSKLKPDEGYGAVGIGGSSDTINPLNSNNEFSLDKLFKETINKNKNTKEWMEENSDILDKNNICRDCEIED